MGDCCFLTIILSKYSTANSIYYGRRLLLYFGKVSLFCLDRLLAAPLSWELLRMLRWRLLLSFVAFSYLLTSLPSIKSMYTFPDRFLPVRPIRWIIRMGDIPES